MVATIPMVDELSKAITKIVNPVLKPEGFRRNRRREFIRHQGGIVQRLDFQVNSWGGRDFCVNISANMVASNEFVTLSPGFRLTRDTDGGDLWLPSETRGEAESSAGVIIESIRDEAFPFFERTRTVQGFSNVLAQEKWGSAHHLHFQRSVAFALLGHTDSAHKHLEIAISLYREDGREWCANKIDKATQLIQALADGNATQLLARWERENAKAHGIS